MDISYFLTTFPFTRGHFASHVCSSIQIRCFICEMLLNLIDIDEVICMRNNGEQAHLAAHKLVHRDLSARNVLVSSTEGVGHASFQCKVGDFGLTRYTGLAMANDEDVFYYRAVNGMIPIRWTALESFQTMVSTIKADVWSFGITMVEVYTDGATPYPTIENDQLVNYLSSGERMARPLCCPLEIFTVLMQCWDVSPTKRPSFKTLVATFTHAFAEAKHPDASNGEGGEQFVAVAEENTIPDESPYRHSSSMLAVATTANATASKTDKQAQYSAFGAVTMQTQRRCLEHEQRPSVLSLDSNENVYMENSRPGGSGFALGAVPPAGGSIPNDIAGITGVPNQQREAIVHAPPVRTVQPSLHHPQSGVEESEV